MLTVNTTYCISSDDEKSITVIRLSKKDDFYNFVVTNLMEIRLTSNSTRFWPVNSLLH